MSRPTSRETYFNIKENGLLSRLRFQVYDIIYQHQPITISQMIRIAASEVTNTGSFTGRISELERMGLIYSVKEDECPVTGRNVIFWGTTDNLPAPLEKKPTKTEIIRDLEKQLAERDQEIVRLKHILRNLRDELEGQSLDIHAGHVGPTVGL